MITIEMNRPGITIGRIGENERTRIRFDISEWLAEYPDGQLTVLCRRPRDAAAYPVPPSQIIRDGEALYWTLSDADLAQTGSGLCELVLRENNVKAKSEIYGIWISDALDGEAEPPEPWESWIDTITDLMDEKIGEAAHQVDLAADQVALAADQVRLAQQEVTNARREAEAAASSAQAAGQYADNADQSARQAAMIVATYGLQGQVISGNKYRMKYGTEEGS